MRYRKSTRNKNAVAMVLSDLLSLLGIVLVTVVFIILLSIIKERPENNIGAERLQLNTETALLNFLRTPAPHLQGIGGDYGDTLTMADLIVLATYNGDYEEILEKEAIEIFGRRYKVFWYFETESRLYNDYGFGREHFSDFELQDLEGDTCNSITQSKTCLEYAPKGKSGATALIYLQGMDGGPIEVNLRTWVLFSGGVTATMPANKI